MTIEAIRALGGDKFTDDFLCVLDNLRCMRDLGGASFVTRAGHEMADTIMELRLSAIQNGTTARFFPALDLCVNIMEREGFSVSKHLEDRAL